MAKKKRRNKENKARIVEAKFITVLPGMLMSAKTLIEKSDFEREKRDMRAFGTGVAAIIMSAHCAELLLKYKIEQEGHVINWKTHDLYDLYKALNADSKVAIEKEYNKQLSTQTPLNGWESAESVFQRARNACMDWRYAVESNDIPLTYFQPLYIAAVSVYKTISILKSDGTWKEETDPAIKARILNT